MIKIEFLEKYKHGTLEFSIGDSFSFEDNIANAIVKAGVAKNVATGEINEKSKTPVAILPNKVTQKI